MVSNAYRSPSACCHCPTFSQALIAVDDVLTSSPSACPPFSQAMTAEVRTMISCRKADYFRQAKDVAGMYDFLRQGMHINTVDMDVILRNDKQIFLLATLCDQPFSSEKTATRTQHCSVPRTPHQRSMIRCLKAEYFGQALDAAAIHALLREGMHIQEIDFVCRRRGQEQIFQLAT